MFSKQFTDVIELPAGILYYVIYHFISIRFAIFQHLGYFSPISGIQWIDQSFNRSIYLSINESIDLFIYQSIYLFINQSIYIFTNQSIYIFINRSIYLFINQCSLVIDSNASQILCVSGIPGKDGPTRPTGHILVRHSQSTREPSCPIGLTRLWSGYSFLYMEGNERSHSQSLGRSISVLDRQTYLLKSMMIVETE